MLDRRHLLQTVGSLTVVSAAGCQSIRDDGDDSPQTADDDGQPAEQEQTEGKDEPDDAPAEGGDGEPRTVTTVTDGDSVEVLLTTAHFATVGDIQETDDDKFHYLMNVEVTEEGQASFDEGLETIDAYEAPEEAPDTYTIRTHVDGEVVVELPLSEELVRNVESSDWQGELMMIFREREDAEAIRDAVQ